VTRVRELEAGDLASVADLWMRVFRKASHPGSLALQAYFGQVFLEPPGVGPRSLVYEKDGRVVGFLGVLRRPVSFEGEPQVAAVTSQFMVDPNGGGGVAGLALMKAFLAGSQDLSFTDGASGNARSIWEALRGEVILPYCCVWTRVLRPGSYLAGKVRERTGWAGGMRLFAPVSAGIDKGARLLPPYAPIRNECRAEEASAEDLVRCVAGLSPKWALRTSYDAAGLGRVLRMAEDATTRGQLIRRVVRDSAGELLGWYVYYAKPRGTARVLQFGGNERRVEQVIGNLFLDAENRGCLAISGRLEPRFAQELARARCSFDFPEVFFLAHSRRKEILAGLNAGRAFLTRLDGEWWLRFHEEDWDRVPVPGNELWRVRETTAQ
jgi:hypothetical protein